MSSISKLKIFIDMDNTIVNLDKHVIDIMNEELGVNYNYKDNTCWWWSDTGIPKKYFANLLYRKGVFLNAPAIENAIECIDKLQEDGHDVIFLTAPQWTGYCMSEKVEWLLNHFKWFDPNRNLVFSARKYLVNNRYSILIDDSEINLSKWKGFKVCFETGCNKDYKDIKYNNWKDIYNHISYIQKAY